MKVVTREVEKEGLEKLLGTRVELLCCRYIYAGDLVGVNDSCVKLENCGIVYETGKLTDKKYKDYQEYPGERYIMLQSIESFGSAK